MAQEVRLVATDVMTYRIPLSRPGGEVIWAVVVVPVDLTEREAERMCRMLMTLPIPA